MFLSNNKFLVILILFIAIFSIGYSFYYQVKPIVDASAYDKIGWNLAQGNGYIESLGNIGHPERDNAIARVGPGYQFFLAGVYYVFGHKIWLVWILHGLLRALTAFFIFKIVQVLFGGSGGSTRSAADHVDPHLIGLVAAGLFGFAPDLIVLNSMLLTETLGIFLLVGAVYFALKYFNFNYGHAMSVIGFSFFGSLAFLTRTTFILVYILVFIVALLKKRWLHALLMVVIITAVVAPWTIRNIKTYDHFVLTTAAGGYDLWVGNNPRATGGFAKTPEMQELRNRYHITEIEKIGWQKYFEFIKEEPLQFIELQFRKASIYFSLARPTGFWGYLNRRPLHQFATLGASALWTAILFVLGIAGGILLFETCQAAKYRSFARSSGARRPALSARRPPTSVGGPSPPRLRELLCNLQVSHLFIIFALLQPLAVIPIIVESRYRTPLFPFLAILAGFFIIYAWQLFTDAGRPQDRKIAKNIFLWSLLFFVVMTFGDISNNWPEFAARLNDIGFL